MNEEITNFTVDSELNIQEEITQATAIDAVDNIESPSAKTEDIDTVDSLKQTIKELQDELESYKNAAEQQKLIEKQLNEFSELFPDIAVRSIPDEVWETVRQGNSLVAAYSVYERRISEAARRIEQINAQNAKKSAGIAGKDLGQEFFSADDVRKMSPSEVRANYAKIRRSMEKWN
jgi:hypothetical protein